MRNDDLCTIEDLAVVAIGIEGLQAVTESGSKHVHDTLILYGLSRLLYRAIEHLHGRLNDHEESRPEVEPIRGKSGVQS